MNFSKRVHHTFDIPGTSTPYLLVFPKRVRRTFCYSRNAYAVSFTTPERRTPYTPRNTRTNTDTNTYTSGRSEILKIFYDFILIFSHFFHTFLFFLLYYCYLTMLESLCFKDFLKLDEPCIRDLKDEFTTHVGCQI